MDYAQSEASWIIYFDRVIAYWMRKNYQLVSKDEKPELFYQSFPQNHSITDEYDKVYPSLNRTNIAFHIDNDGPHDSLGITLDHTMPYFDHFLVRIDESSWNKTDNTFGWVLDNGVNTIEVKAVNVVGVEGKPSRIVLKNNIR
jgi:hypothetical protein